MKIASIVLFVLLVLPQRLWAQLGEDVVCRDLARWRGFDAQHQVLDGLQYDALARRLHAPFSEISECLALHECASERRNIAPQCFSSVK